MNYIIIISKLCKYLGTISLNKDSHLKTDTTDQSLKNLIQKITQEPVTIMQCQHEEKDGKSAHVLYAKEVFLKDGVLYLEGIKQALRNKNLQAHVLEENKAKLLALTLQSKIPEHIKQAIFQNFQDIPKDKIKKLTNLFEEEKQGLKKIEKEFQ